MGLVIGITLGSGIVRKPASIAARVPDPALMLGVWLIGGLISLAGALSVAELAATFSYTGGWLRGPPGGVGSTCGIPFRLGGTRPHQSHCHWRHCDSLQRVLTCSIGYDPTALGRTADYVAVVAIVGAATVNIRGVQPRGHPCGRVSAAKFAALALLVAASLTLGGGAGASVTHFAADAGPATPEFFGLALISVV